MELLIYITSYHHHNLFHYQYIFKSSENIYNYLVVWFITLSITLIHKFLITARVIILPVALITFTCWEETLIT